MPLCEPRPPPTPLENRQAANKTTAIIVPALLIGVVGYATWVVVVLIGGKYYLQVFTESWVVDEELESANRFSRIEPIFLHKRILRIQC